MSMPYTEKQYTERMKAVYDGIQVGIIPYTGEHFTHMLKELEEAWHTSARASREQKLLDMLDACRIDWKADGEPDGLQWYKNLAEKHRLTEIPGVEQQVLHALYEQYREYPTPEAYMQRMVERLSQDPWQGDSLRLRILKQFIKYGDYLKDAGYGSKRTIQKYAKEKSGRKKLTEDELLEVLDDGVFELLENLNDEIRHLDGQGLTDVKNAKENLKDKKKPKGVYGLLKTADDLAAGKFRSGGATRKSLYLFAMVYGMTYFCPGSANGGERRDYATDIEKNLFQDYYMNNVMRFLSEHYEGRQGEYEAPAEQGVNYKNFAEMIYLYFIRQDCSPQEKIRRSEQMIQRVKNSQASPAPEDVLRAEPSEAERSLTRRCREMAGADAAAAELWDLPEPEFEAFLREHYDCRTQKGNRPIAPIQVQTEQNSAYAVYQSLLRELKAPLVQYYYGLDCVDAAALERFEQSYMQELDADRERFGEFRKLMLEVNEILGHTVHEKESRETDREKQERKEKREGQTNIPAKPIDALAVDSPEGMTRTALVTAFYYYFNESNENRCWDDPSAFVDDFTSEINEKLEAAYYEPISCKNIFDVLTIVSSYIRINI